MRLCVIGLGRLGLPWALLADAVGHEVRGLDVNRARVEAINSRVIDTAEPGVASLLGDPSCGLVASTEPGEALANTDCSVITVPTPSQADGSFGLQAVLAAVQTVGAHARALAPQHVVVLKSTVSPGATEGPVRSALAAASGFDSSEDGPFLVHAPEFHAIGSVVHDITNPYLLILGGRDDWALSQVEELHRSLAKRPIETAWLDATGAELAKLASNSFRTMKIAFANSLAQLSTAYGSDPRAVSAVVGADPHIGYGYLGPGLPYGGPCYPRDNHALAAAATTVKVPSPLPDAIEAANEQRFDEIERAVLGAGSGPIGIVGLGFKSGADELEGSPAVKLAMRWEAAGRDVLVHDPLVAASQFQMVSLTALVESCSVLLLATPDERIVEKLQVELAGQEHPPVTIDPWCALSWL